MRGLECPARRREVFYLSSFTIAGVPKHLVDCDRITGLSETPMVEWTDAPARFNSKDREARLKMPWKQTATNKVVSSSTSKSKRPPQKKLPKGLRSEVHQEFTVVN